MKLKLLFIILALSVSLTLSYADTPKSEDNNLIQEILNDHYNTYKDQEYFSGISLSFKIPQENIQNYYTGFKSHNSNKPIDKHTLFEIGSITKSFTAALILQLEKEKKLSLNDKLEKWLPEYSKWSKIPIKKLLNMTNGIPNYSDSPLWNTQAYKNPTTYWTSKELIDFAYPEGKTSPPRKTNYYYTNTGYILSQLIIDLSTEDNFKSQLQSKIIKKADLNNTFYPIPSFNKDIKTRMASGYNYNQYDNAKLVGKDVSDTNLSWGAAAGGIVSNSEDIIKWVNALFIKNQILDNLQKKKLMQLVSTNTGKSINTTTQEEPRGFGLGVIQAYNKEIGRYWFYEGETLGFRALYMYVPCNNIIISSIFNSATNSENDNSSKLMIKIYKKLLDRNPILNCNL